ncbi:hypothetical protein F5B20DRAFT_167238 [Whalleya microplaca]|nr:hypothetical protein F5B20DRAFT_167238 [Whalleya microplaca]
MSTFIRPEVLSDLIELGRPTSILDAVALAAVGVGSAAYLLKGVPWNQPDPYYHLWFERPQFKDGVQHDRVQATRNIAEKLEQSNKNVVIFWGSQSGTAESFAHRLARECHLRFGLEVLAADLSDYDANTISLIPESKLAIFILSTFGEGDPSDNAAGFWEWIHKNSSSLPSLQYAAFGLGNSNYKYYNRVVDVAVEGLDKGGAKRLLPVGKADDCNDGTEEDFLAWKDDLFTAFREKLGHQERDVPYSPGIAIREDTSLEPIDLHHGTPIESNATNRQKSAKTSPIKALAISNAYELYTSSKRNCIHIELEIGEYPELRYKTGDHLVVYPMIPDEEVHILLQALGLEERATIPLVISAIEEGSTDKLPSPTTVEALFRHYLEICAPVSRDTVRDLAKFAPTEEAKQLLISLGRDKESYSAFVSKKHVTIGRLLALAAPGAIWTDLPLSYLIETIAPIQPRYYSISSSSVISARRLAITVGVEKTPLPHAAETEIHGLTTNYLLALANSLDTAAPLTKDPSPTYALAGPAGALEGHKIFAAIRKSKFKLPTLPSTPLILIAAGTGIAPFRAFVQERARLRSIGKPVGRTMLFFGSRNPDEDFLYREELNEAGKTLDGALEVVSAFSRVPGQEKVYVQDRIAQRGREVCELLDQGASLYICGRAAMAREVGKVVQEAMMEVHGWEQAKVSEWGDSVKKGNKWSEDVWG